MDKISKVAEVNNQKILKLFQKKSQLEKDRSDSFIGFHYYTALTFFFWILIDKPHKLPNNWYDWLGAFIVYAYLIIWLVSTFATLRVWGKLQNYSKQIAKIDKEINEELSKF